MQGEAKSKSGEAFRFLCACPAYIKDADDDSSEGRSEATNRVGNKSVAETRPRRRDEQKSGGFGFSSLSGQDHSRGLGVSKYIVLRKSMRVPRGPVDQQVVLFQAALRGRTTCSKIFSLRSSFAYRSPPARPLHMLRFAWWQVRNPMPKFLRTGTASSCVSPRIRQSRSGRC